MEKWDHPEWIRLHRAISEEALGQMEKFREDSQQGLHKLRADGLALYPLRILHQRYGYADYPEFSFKIPFPVEHQFRDGSAVLCSVDGDEGTKAILLCFDGLKGDVRLLAPDFPDQFQDKQIALLLVPDTRTTRAMTEALNSIPGDPRLKNLFTQWHKQTNRQDHFMPGSDDDYKVEGDLNPSQQRAISRLQQLVSDELLLLHGPPGTGKTKTLSEGILQLTRDQHKVLVSAPSNAAVDHLAKGLIERGIRIVRLGHSAKIATEVLPYSLEGIWQESHHQKQIRQWRQQAEAFRKMALTYKRHFGREEREQRQLLFKEVKSLRELIRNELNHQIDKKLQQAQVVIGTPVALADAGLTEKFHTLIIDEAGQCLEPLAWMLIPYAERYVLAGDPFQLPPTVISDKALQLAFNQSILDTTFYTASYKILLDTQYRMRNQIAGFSASWFYQGKLKSAKHLQDTGNHLCFWDTAGSGYEEEPGPDGVSLINPGELTMIQPLLDLYQINIHELAFISPYAAQVNKARQQLAPEIRCATVDSFQGQEYPVIILSMVRSNEQGVLGFLKDYRRMNVAMTRAKERLIVLGDSITLQKDSFYQAWLDYVESAGEYRSVFEIIQ